MWSNFGSRIGIDFLAQIIDIHVNDIGRRVEGIIPHLFRNHGAGQHPPRVPHKVVEEGELSRRQCDLGSPAGYGTSRRVEDEVAHLQDGRLDLWTPP